MYSQSVVCSLKVDPNKRNRSGCEEPTRVADYLRDLPVGARAANLADLNRQLHQRLPPALAGHIMLADIRTGRAVFLADTPAWAARTRLQQERLRHDLLALGQQVGSIAVKVIQPERVPHTHEPLKPLTSATADHLRSAAASLSDPELRARFLELASLADKTS